MKTFVRWFFALAMIFGICVQATPVAHADTTSAASACDPATGTPIVTESSSTTDQLHSWDRVRIDFCGLKQSKGDVLTIKLDDTSVIAFNIGSYPLYGKDGVTQIGTISSDGKTATVNFTSDVDGWKANLWAAIEQSSNGDVNTTITVDGKAFQVKVGTRVDDCDVNCQQKLPVGSHQKWASIEFKPDGSLRINSGLWVVANGDSLTVNDEITDGASKFDCTSVYTSANPNTGRNADGSQKSADLNPSGAKVELCTDTSVTVTWPKTVPGYMYYLGIGATPLNQGRIDSETGLPYYGDTGTFSQISKPADAKALVYGGGGSGFASLPPAPQLKPGVSITKTAGTVVDANKDRVIGDAGDTISYTFAVRNTGNVVLNSIKVSDPMLAKTGIKITCPSSQLAVGGKMVCTSVYTIQAADAKNGKVCNTATVSTDKTGNVPSNTVCTKTKQNPAKTMKVSFRVQFDRIKPKTKAQANILNNVLKDLKWHYREDVRWNRKTGKVYAAQLWATKPYSEIRTLQVTVPVTYTKAQIIEAEKQVTRDYYGLGKTTPTAKVGVTSYTAWLIPNGAWDNTTSWKVGPKTAPQLLVTR